MRAWERDRERSLMSLPAGILVCSMGDHVFPLPEHFIAGPDPACPDGERYVLSLASFNETRAEFGLPPVYADELREWTCWG